MLLSDRSIRNRLGLAPGHPQRLVVTDVDLDRDLQPSSIDVYLGDTLLVYTGAVMDTRRDNSPWWHPVSVDTDQDGPHWKLERGRFYLGALRHRLILPSDLTATLTGCSTEARMGLVLHQQAGHGDPGYDGNLTLEITTVAAEATVVQPGRRIGQILFTLLDTPCSTPYHGRYQGLTRPSPARPHSKEMAANVV